MTVLLTGFGPFGDVGDNPSEVVVRGLDGREIAGSSVAALVLPVSTTRAATALLEAIERTSPELIIVTGVAPGRTGVSLERVALNVRDFPLPDVDGAAPVDEAVVAEGPAAYLSGLPVKAILSRWAQAGIPGYLSNTAGTYVCNQCFYVASHAARERDIAAGLVHFPATPQSLDIGDGHQGVPAATMEPETLVRATALAIEVALTHRGKDLSISAGAVS